MDNKKDLTRELLADCFKELMESVPFDKITIKMITDRAGLIRPTFYKHFQDKYEVLEWIFETEVAKNVDLLIDHQMEFDAVVMLLRCLAKDRRFYKKAYQMEENPNSFEHIFTRYVYNSIYRIAKRHPLRTKEKIPLLNHKMYATYYTYSLVNIVKDWILQDDDSSPEDISAAYLYLVSHAATDLIPFKPAK